jgi:hypothetical protein
MQSIVGTWKLLHATARDAAGAARPLPYGGSLKLTDIDSAHAFDRRSMEESIAGAIRELDKAVPFSRIVPFQLAPNRRRGRFAELWPGKLRGDLGMP